MIIQYKYEDNCISIVGTNQVLDWIPNLLPLPFFGFHLGAFFASLNIFFTCKPKMNRLKKVYLSGHSLGGAVCSVLAILFMLSGFKVHTETQGAYKAVSWWWALTYRLEGNTSFCRVYGNDPVPRFWIWFFNLSRRKLGGPKRRWWKVNFKDHVKY